MKILLLGATGATGRLVAEQVLANGHSIAAIVRSPESLPDAVSQDPNCTVIQGNVLEISDSELAKRISDCHAVVSCLGHNLTFKGMYGHPRKLVRDTVQRICDIIKKDKPGTSYRFILMNSAGVGNKDASEVISFGQKAILGLIRLLVPPHVDNEQAADFLRKEIGQSDSQIQWVVVRPDTLTDMDEVSPYDVHSSPIRSALFNPGKTSRINVAHFMAELLINDDLCEKWKGKMPVLYNRE